MRETQVQSLGWEDPLDRKWQLTPVFLPGETHGWRSLVGYSPWGCKESDMTELHHFFSHPYMTTGKTIALTRQIFVDKVMSLLFNMLSGWS